MLVLLDIVLFTVHVVVIGINSFAWLFRKTRKLHLVVIVTTAFSWFIIGLWYGMGYCFLTDWEWEIKRQLGETNLPSSFVHYLVNRSLGLSISEGTLDFLTGAVFAIALVGSVVLNLRDRRVAS